MHQTGNGNVEPYVGAERGQSLHLSNFDSIDRSGSDTSHGSENSTGSSEQSDAKELPLWIVVAVLGRPSASIRDFFNSIKFAVSEVRAGSLAEALDRGDPYHDRPVRIPDGYEMLNWYAFPKDERISVENVRDLAALNLGI